MQRLLETHELEEAVFTRALSVNEKTVIVNRYIAALFYNNRDEHHQIELFADNYDMSLQKRFNSNCNFNRHNRELDGYTADEICGDETALTVANEINNRLKQVRESILASINTENVAELRKYAGYGINIDWRYPNRREFLLMAAEKNNWDVMLVLIKRFYCNPNIINSEGCSLITHACRSAKINIVRGILEMDEDFINDFLDDENPNYNEANDALKIIIDMDRPELLDNLLLGLKSKRLFSKHIAQFSKMLHYAMEHQKTRIAYYLQLKMVEMQKLEITLMQAISNKNLSEVNNCLLHKVDVNKEINGKYPLELACSLCDWDIVFALLKNDDIIFSSLYNSNNSDYNVRLDIVKYIVDSDQIAPFTTFLRTEIEGQVNDSYSTLELIRQYAMQNSRMAILRFVSNVINLANENLFRAAVQCDSNGIISALDQHANINYVCGGKSVIHVICETGNVEALRLLLHRPNIDFNFANMDGDYPITVACKQNNYRALEILLDAETVRKCNFMSQDSNYLSKLDVIKNIIDADNVAFLEPVLRRRGTSGDFIYVNYDNVRLLHNYAASQHKILCANKLAIFVDRLTVNPSLFEPEGLLQSLGNETQGVSKVEMSFTISIMNLCNRYNASIEPISGKKYSKLRLYETDVLAELSKLERMISFAKANGYKVQEENPLAKTDRRAPKFIVREISDEQYRKWAYDSYKKLKTAVNGTTWHSAWINPKTKKLDYQSGINMAEVWALAILAIQDPFAVSEIEYSEQDIRDREQILVATLVESTRAYSYDLENYIDSQAYLANQPKTSAESCEHGVAVRAMLALCGGLHDDVHIHENPIEWAHYVAKGALQTFFNQVENRQELNDLLIKHKFQRSTAENKIVEEFYNEAGNVVNIELIRVVGMTDNYGYLEPKDLQDILSDLESIELELTRMSIQQNEFAVIRAENFSKLAFDGFLNHNELLVSQYKLPLSSDSIFAAIIIAAKANQIELPPKITVHKLRHMVAHIIYCVVHNIQNLKTNLSMIFRNCTVNPMQSTLVIASIKQLIKNSRILEDDPNATEYLHAMRLYAQPDNLVLTLISALLGARIVCYDFTGVPIAQYNTTQIFLPPKNDRCIDYSCRVIQDGSKFAQDRSICCAVVNSERWIDIRGELASFEITDTASRIAKDNQYCKDYTVMLERNIAGFEQIKIPGGDDNLIISVFVAARCANVSNDYAFTVLKKLVQDSEILQLVNSYAITLDFLARLYEVKIIVYDLAANQPQTYGVGGVELKLHKTNQHFNLLLQPRNWFGFDERLLQAVAPVLGAGSEMELQENVNSASSIKRARYSY